MFTAVSLLTRRHRPGTVTFWCVAMLGAQLISPLAIAAAAPEVNDPWPDVHQFEHDPADSRGIDEGHARPGAKASAQVLSLTGNVLNQRLNATRSLFDRPVRITSQFGLDEDNLISGELDLVIPLGSLPDDILQRQTSLCSAWIVQPGAAIWDSAWGEIRYDFNMGVVYRFKPGCDNRIALGAGAFVDTNANTGSTRASLGFDMQYQGLYSVVNFYQPLTGWRSSGKGLDERPLEGYTAELQIPLFSNFRLGLERAAWRSGAGADLADPRGDRYSTSLSYDVTDNIRVELTNHHLEGRGDNLEGMMRFSWPGSFGAYSDQTDLFRVLEREKRVQVERDSFGNVTFAFDKRAVLEGSTVNFTVTLDRPAPRDKTLTFLLRPRTGPQALAAVQSSTASLTAHKRLAGTSTPVSPEIAPAILIGVLASVAIIGGQVAIAGSFSIPDDDDQQGHVDYEAVSADDEASVPTGPDSTITVYDDESPIESPAITLSTAGPTTIEESVFGRMKLEVSARLSIPAQQDIDYRLDFQGTAQAGVDFETSTQVLHFPAGQSEASFTLTSIIDDQVEGNEEIRISAIDDEAAVARTVEPLVVRIEDQTPADPGIEIVGPNITISEAGGTANILLRSATGTGPIGAMLFTGNSTLEPGVHQPLDFEPGGLFVLGPDSSLQARVSAVDDDIAQGNRTVRVFAAETPVQGSLIQRQNSNVILVTIIDDDGGNAPEAVPSLDFETANAAQSIREGDETVIRVRNGNIARFPAPFRITVEGDATVSAGTGIESLGSASDFQLQAGVSQGELRIRSTQDNRVEGQQAIRLSLSGTQGTLTGAQNAFSVVVNDDDTAEVTLSANNLQLSESGGSSTITASLSRPSASTVNITLALAGTATNGQDYTAGTLDLSFAPDQQTVTTTVTTRQDTLVEPSETVSISVGSATGASVAGAPVSLTITDDDVALPSLTMTAGPSSISENNGIGSVDVMLDRAATSEVTINLAIGGTATGYGTDFTIPGAVITIPVGGFSGAMTFNTVDDNLVEGSETIQFSVQSVTGATNASSTATVTVLDDD